jgi:arsenate reductase
MIRIFHNPRCRKSREGLAIVENSGKPFEIVRYQDEPLTKSELKGLLRLLGVKAIDLVRKQEAIWKTDYKGKNLSEDEILDALLDHPKLIERPLVTFEGKAVIGRPAEKITELLG